MVPQFCQWEGFIAFLNLSLISFVIVKLPFGGGFCVRHHCNTWIFQSKHLSADLCGFSNHNLSIRVRGEMKWQKQSKGILLQLSVIINFDNILSFYFELLLFRFFYLKNKQHGWKTNKGYIPNETCSYAFSVRETCLTLSAAVPVWTTKNFTIGRSNPTSLTSLFLLSLGAVFNVFYTNSICNNDAWIA